MHRIGLLAFLTFAPLAAQDAPPARAGWPERLESAAHSAAAWKARHDDIRRQILVAAGLYPEFDRPPLKSEIWGKFEGDDFTVERTVLETLPGFYLSGSLYRPKGKSGPFPAILSPHGHWKEGRFTQEPVGNLPARGITFARLGFVCFMYDMVGYGDFKQLPHKFDDADWGQGLFGLQTWNSLRAVDFISSLPDVDPKRIGCTGASGGGTQTFILTAIDDRIACAAPVNMVAAEFQGGCTCENAPFLRIDLNNVEIAAMTAPRPLLLVAATGDWTKNVPTLEGPAVAKAYQSLGVPERFRAVQFAAPHNYNQDSRETVYAWMFRWLKDSPDQPRIPEPPVPHLNHEDLAVWTESHRAPENAVTADSLREFLRGRVRAQLDALRPKDGPSLKRYRELFEPAWRVTLSTRPAGHPVTWEGTGRATVFVSPTAEAAAPYLEGFRLHGKSGDAQTCLVLLPHSAETPAGGDASQRKGFPATFYRTELARQVQDIVDLIESLHRSGNVSQIRLVGIGAAGLPVLLSRAVSPARVGLTVVDLGSLEPGMESAHAPGLHRLGGWQGAAMLAPAGVLVLHGGKADTAPIQAAYHAAGRDSAFVHSEEPWSRDRVLAELGK